MLNRQTISKIRQEMKGLNNWPMSSSYPQDSGQREFKEMLRSIKTREEEDKVNMTVEVTSENKWNVQDCWSKMSKIFWNYFCGIKDENSDLDEVDGGREDLLKPLVKLYFLKILFIDIGISLGDVVTDLAQGINLIFDHNWNIQWSTFQYGVIVLVLVWLPLVPLALHVVTFRKAAQYYQNENKLLNILVIAASIIFFPLVPTFMYARVLMMKRSFTSNRNKLKFLEFEQKATEVKSIVGSIESPLQFILMLWLMFRGILTLPWDQPLSSSCVEDSLGRVACLPSIPMVSMLFSLLSILKSVFDLNMSAVSSASLSSLTKSKVCQHLVLCFFPFYLCNILFRLPAYAFILTFIDIWSLIPGLVLYVLQLALCGLFFIRQEPEEADVPLDNIMKGSTGTINQASTDDQGRPGQTLVWDGQHWTSNSVTGNSARQRLENNQIDFCEGAEDASLDPVRLIDESNSPLFLNSLAGYFFPCVHLEFNPEQRTNISSLRRVSQLTQWQLKVTRAQTFLFNINILVVLTSVFILVTFVQSFNYKYNIFTFSWFSLMLGYLVFMGVVTTGWSVWIYPSETFPIKSSSSDQKERGEERGEEARRRRRHTTGDSNTESVISATASMVRGEAAGPELTSSKLSYCSLLSLLALLPCITGFLLYRFSPGQELYFVQFGQTESDGQVQVHMVKTVDHFGLEGPLEWRRVERILITNRTVIDQSANEEMILFVDTRPPDYRRKSSPRKPMFKAGSAVVTVRQSEWEKMPVVTDGGFLTNLPDPSPYLQSLGQCSGDQRIFINYRRNTSKISERKKFLSTSGEVREVWKLRVSCFTDEFSCKTTFPQTLSFNCNNIVIEDESQYFESETGVELKKTKILNHKGSSNNYCCKNSTHFIEIFGDFKTIASNFLQNHCNYSKLMQEKSHQLPKTFFRICQLGDLLVKETHTTNIKGEIITDICDVDKYVC